MNKLLKFTAKLFVSAVLASTLILGIAYAVQTGGADVSGQWDDMRIVPSAFDFAGVLDPTLADWDVDGSGHLYKVWEFAQNDEAFFTTQLSHSYKPGTDLYVHVHWTPGTRGNEETGKTVAWKVQCNWAALDGVFSGSGTYDLTDTCTGVDSAHLITPEVLVSGSGMSLSTMFMCRVYRDTGDSWASSTHNQLPIILETDFHFKQDSTGSRTQDSKY